MQISIFDFLGAIFDTAGFPARWHCGLWTSGHGWLHIASDLLIWSAYFAIPVVLLYFLRRYPDLPMPRVVWLFAAFIFACGAGHLLEALIFWWPAYRLAGIIKALTAVASWATVFALIRTTPSALELPRAAARTNEVEQERVQAERRATSLELPIRAGKIGTWVMTAPGQATVINDRLREMFGFAEDFEPTLADILEVIHADDRDRVSETLARAYETGEAYVEEFRALLPNGGISHVTVQGAGWKEGPDSNFLVTGACTLVHETELALRESERRLRMAVDAAHAGFWTWEVTNNEAFWDERMEEIYGVAPGGFNRAYSGFAERVHPEDLPAVEEALQKALEGGPDFKAVHRIRAGERWRYVEEHGLVDWDASGKPLRMTGLCLDITDRVLAEEGLRRATKELEEFAYVASHDLRAPMRAIDNLTQWIVEDSAELLPAASRTHLDKLQQRVRRMERLLDDIQAFSRAGRLSHPPEKVDLKALVSEVIQTLSPPDGFEVRIEGSLPTIVAPRTQLEQVFTNLVGNAIKHHDRDDGHVVVSGRETAMFVEFTVEDDGPGIPVELRERAFQMFETLKPRDQVEGSGIGLAVVKKLVRSVGGRIWMAPAAERGATFHFTWPKSGVESA